MKRANLLRIVILGLFVAFCLGCASAFMKGGKLMSAGYIPQNVIVSYKAEGTVPPGVVYQLVNTEWGEAMFEKSPDGSGALFLTRWQDIEGDHFGGWVATSHGYEFVVPLNRTQNAKKYVYVHGTYRYEETGGGGRLVPTVKVDPVATLIPQ